MVAESYSRMELLPNYVMSNSDFTSGRSPYMLATSSTIKILVLEGGLYDKLSL